MAGFRPSIPHTKSYTFTFLNEATFTPDLTSGPSVATEFVCGSITSSGLPGLAGLSTLALGAVNPGLTYANGDDHGYALVDLAAGEAKVTYRTAKINTPDAPSRDLAVYRQPAGENDYETVSQAVMRDATLPDVPTGAQLRSATAPNQALAKRRRKHERLEDAARARTEQRERATSRRRKAHRS